MRIFEKKTSFFDKPIQGNERKIRRIFLLRPRQGLSQVARKGGGLLPACRAGDLGSPRKAAGQLPGNRVLPAKARSRPKKGKKRENLTVGHQLAHASGRRLD
jgi:hypothetical protein